MEQEKKGEKVDCSVDCLCGMVVQLAGKSLIR